jgi:hypothetical protein
VTRTEVLKFTAPVIAMGGVFVSRKALAAGYSAATGSPPPTADDLDVPIGRVLVFAASAALAAAVINTLITRGFALAVARSQELVDD